MLKITILCENTAQGGLIGEHGFSALIEHRNGALLLDTGAGLGLLHNVLTLGKDLSRVTRIALSHGHYDHTGGMLDALKLTSRVEVWAHPDVFAPKTAVVGPKASPIRRYIGIPYVREHMELLGANFNLDTGFRQIAEDIFLTGEVPRRTDFEKSDARLCVRQGTEYIPDPFLDDQSVIIKTSEGLVIVYGCAHAGMINIIRHAQNMTGETRIRALLGGTHLGPLSEEQLEASIEELEKIDPRTVAVSHCTGMKAAARLSLALGDKFEFANTGSVFDFS